MRLRPDLCAEGDDGGRHVRPFRQSEYPPGVKGAGYPAAVASAKQLIGAVAHLSLEDAIPVTSKWIAALRATPEAREGFAAFLGKRRPGWMP